MNDPNVFWLGSFSVAGCAPFVGMVCNDQVVALSALGSRLLNGSLLDVLEDWEGARPILFGAARRWHEGRLAIADLAVPLDRLTIHAPFRPRQIFGMGANYRKHVVELVMADPDMRAGDLEVADDASRRAAAERMMDERANDGEPYVFSKLPSSVAGPFDPLPIPRNVQKADWECELAVVIGRPARHVAAADAMSHIAGYAIANDVTARDLVFRRDVPVMGTDWVSSKSQPGFMPFGPYLVPARFVDPANVTISLELNESSMQNESSGDMLIPIARQIEYLSSRIQLQPGDVICTGSPAGNGSHHGVFLKPGDVMVASITGLGKQRVSCIEG